MGTPAPSKHPCPAPEGYVQPDEPQDFDGHDYEGFPGGCARMECRPAPTDDELQALADDPTLYEDYRYMGGSVEFLCPVRFGRAVLAKWGITAAQKGAKP